MTCPLEGFPEIWCVDFEFGAAPGGRPAVRCMVAREYHSGKLMRLWADELAALSTPPFPVNENALFVAYYASAEFGCLLQLGWQLPERVLDLFTEFRNLRNGLDGGAGLIVALRHYGLESIESAEKDAMRDLALRGGAYSDQEKSDLLDYCQSDVDALVKLLPKMIGDIDFPRAILRGRYMKAVARMEHVGVPLDTEVHKHLTQNWDTLKLRLIEEVDKAYGVFDGLTFKQDRFAEYLKTHDIPWPRTEAGRLQLPESTFRRMARAYPKIAPIHELRNNLGKLKLNDLAIGEDCRNRTLLSPFRSRTGRNQPSNTKFIYGPSVWIRGLIKPEEGYGLAYIDWSQQEFGIAAALSGDKAMKEAYLSGDPYLEFAKQAGAVPESATKETHANEREQFKACVLAVQYGMGEKSLAESIGQPPIIARHLLKLHRQTYSRFWAWSDRMLDNAMLTGKIQTVFGWTQYVGDNANPRSLRNFPMQANGAEMLRVACIYASEKGVRVCAPVHDAMLIEAPLDDLDEAINVTQASMAKASRVILDGFELHTGVEQEIRYPERYADKRGDEMWRKVMGLLE